MSTTFKTPRNNRGKLLFIISVRLSEQDIEAVNELIDAQDREASEIIRDAIREYSAFHRRVRTIPEQETG